MKNHQFRLLTVISAFTLLSATNLSAYAGAPDASGPGAANEMGKKDHDGFCGDQDLSATQKQQMKDEHFKFEEKKIDLEASARHARLSFEKIASNEKSSEGDIEKAAEDVAAAQSKIITAEELFHAHVLSKILKPEQREKAMKCHLMMGPHHPGQGPGALGQGPHEQRD